MRTRFSIASLFRRSRKNRRKQLFSPSIETLECRRVFASWTPTNNAPPASLGTMMLQTDGTVLAHGTGTTNLWYKLTPDSHGSYVNGTWSSAATMAQTRLYYGSNVLTDGRVIVLGGEYSSAGSWTNTGEIFNPLTNTWTAMANFPSVQFGDGQTILLPNGKILAGNLSDTRCFLYDPTNNTWSPAGSKIHGDRNNEETWTLLPDGDVISYDIFSSISTGIPQAQRYDFATDTWIDAGTLPALLSTSTIGYEVGAAVRLMDGRIFQIGGNSNTAIYDPTANTWTAGPSIPGGKGADDAPAAVMPNGHVIFSADTPLFVAPTRMFDFDPVANTITDITSTLPSALQTQLGGIASYRSRMLMLPTGEMLLSPDSFGGGVAYVYQPDGGPANSLRPTIASIVPNTDTVFTLSGTQLTGQSAGASYGDDAEMDTNFPIVQLTATDGSGNVTYARSFNWTPGVATGNTLVSTQFEVPAGLAQGVYDVRVIASGIASTPFTLDTFPGLGVASSNPQNGALVNTALTSFTINFNETVQIATLNASDLQVNGFPANGVTLDSSGKSATFTYASSPLTIQGTQTISMAAGVVMGSDGSSNRPYTATFRFDASALSVVGTNPAVGQGFVLPGPFTLEVTFNESIDPTSVGLSDLQVAGMTGVSVSAFSILPGNKTVQFSLAGIDREGAITASISEGAILDSFGNTTMIPFNATYYVDLTSVVLPAPFSVVGAPGTQVYRSEGNGIVNFAGDTDSYTLNLDSNQTLAIVADPTAAGLQPRIELIDGRGAVVATAAASAVGQSAILNATAITGGAYSIRLSGLANTVGAYSFRAILNAAIEKSESLTSNNDSIAAAQSIDSSFIAEGSSGIVGRGAILGADSATGPWSDYYSLSAVAGDSISLVLSNLTGAASLTLEDSTGAVIASGASGASNFGVGIQNVSLPAAGRYYLHVLGTSAATYSLVALKNASFDSESNNSAGTATPLGANGSVGSVNTGSTTSLSVNAVDSGWWNSAGNHNAGVKNYLAGQLTSASYRNFFVFSLAGITDTITGAQLHVSVPANGYTSVDASETYQLFDVTTPTVLLRSTRNGLTAIYDDLGTGTSFGSQSVSASNNADFVNVNLNADSLNALNIARGGDFALGGGLSTISGTGNQYVFGFTGVGADTKQLVLSLGDPEDWYSVTLEPGQDRLSLVSSTPGDGSGNFANSVDVKLDLFDETGTVLIASGVSLSDGRNEVLRATGLTAGATYKVRVTTQNGSGGEYVISKEVSSGDIVMGSLQANGGNLMTLTYSVVGAAVAPFQMGFYQSTDTTNDPLDTLTGTYLVSNPADLTVGSHSLSLTIGNGLGQVSLPGAGTVLPGFDFYTLVVANDNRATPESSFGNNTAPLTGVYHLAGGDVIVQGTDNADTVLLTVGQASRLTLNNNAIPYVYPSGDVSAFDFYPHAGDDSVTGTGVSRRMNFFASTGTDNLSGGSIANTLFAPNGENNWLLSGTNSGTLNATTFKSIANLVGGTGGDQFSVGPGASLTGKLDGNAGSNSIDYSNYAAAVSINLQLQTATGLTRSFVNINAVVGGNSINTLTGSNSANNWQVTGSNQGAVNGFQFTNFGYLVGGTASDTFAFLDPGLVVAVDGKGGTDSIDYGNATSNTTVNLQSKTATGVTTNWNSIESVVGNGTSSTLIGSNVNATWALSSSNSGTFNSNFSFLGIANLIGGSANDTFRFSDAAVVTGVIDGNAGVNSLDFTSYSVGISTNLQIGRSTGTGSILNISNVTGGQGDDILVGDAKANNLVGGGGVNMMIGGGGRDSLVAGTAGDILIGTQTAYDANVAALDAIMSVWKNSSLTYADRVLAIQSGVNYSDSTGTHSAALTASNTLEDNASDTLSGGSGVDWYFARLTGSNKDVINNRKSGELVTII